MKIARWLLPIVSLLLVAALTWWELSRSHAGPGPLHPAHAAVASLEGGANCAACHRDGAVSVRACLDCHSTIGAQVIAGTGLHAAFGEAACETCHPEHHGGVVPLLPPHAFERAGIADVQAYDHRHVAFELQGVHTQLPCARCHEHADDLEPPAGGRFLGLSQQCTSCHVDEHQSAFGLDCASCHGQTEPFAAVPNFSHDRFPLADAHGQVACAACHEDGGGHEIAQKNGGVLAVRSCRECHDDPHDVQSSIAATALQLPDSENCARCHANDEWASARPTTAEHGELGFALRGVHEQVACMLCHGGGDHDAMWQGQGPEVAACAACHQSPHAAAVVRVATADVGPTTGCAGCHSDADADFAAGRISVAHHRATGFALAEPHVDLACATCHQGIDRQQRFPGRDAADCRSCHGDAHGGQFTAASQLQQCTDCHQQTRFLPHQFGPSLHKRAFALTGAHDAVACNSCHESVVNGVRQFVGTKRGCSDCHVDVHAGNFDTRGRPLSVDGRTGCARCHDTTAFRKVSGGFDHTLWTGYALVGAHQNVNCASCHDGQTPRRLGKVAGATCASCHSDPHVGQFQKAGTTDCRSCHDATAWTNSHFDHQRDSRFELDDVHKNLACSQCHASYQSGKRKVVRYKPLGAKCGDCHQLGSGGRK